MKVSAPQRLAVSIAALGVMVGLSMISLESARPTSLLDAMSGREPYFPPFSWFGLGVRPLLVGFMLVELVCVAVPPLRWRRVSGEGPRRPLVYVSWGLGLALVALQAWSASRAAEDLLFGAKVMAGTLVVWGLTVAGGRFGLLNGFALAALASLGGLDDVQQVQRLLASDGVTPGAVLVLVAVLAGAVWTLTFLTRRPAPSAEVPVRAPPPISGLGMTATAGALLSLPAALSSFVPGMMDVQRTLQQSGSVYRALWIGLAVLPTIVWSFIYFRPRAVASVWKRWNPELDEVSATLAARALLPPGLRDALLLNVAFAVAIDVTLGFGTGLVAAALVATLIVLDGLDEWRFRVTHGALTTVLEVQRVPEVDAVLHRLSSNGVPAVARARHYRVVDQFFAPNVPVEVMVPAARADEAKALLAT